MVEKKTTLYSICFHILLIFSDEFFWYTFTKKKRKYDNKKIQQTQGEIICNIPL